MSCVSLVFPSDLNRNNKKKVLYGLVPKRNCYRGWKGIYWKILLLDVFHSIFYYPLDF